MKKYTKKFLSSLIFSAVGLYTFIFFTPLEVYLGNLSDFQINIDWAILILATIAFALALVFSSIVSLLPVKFLRIINFCVLGITICYYVQSLFLNNSMTILTGETLNVPTSTKILNLMIWIFIFAIIFILWGIVKNLHKEKSFITVTKFVAAALAVMQTVGFLSLYLNCDKSVNETKSIYYSVDGQLQVSKNKNILYFVIDYADTTIINEALKEEPTLFDNLGGFTYYADNVFTHSRSFPAITYLLSGEKYHFDIDYKDYVNNSIKDSPFLNVMDSMGTDIRLYTDSRFVGNKATELIDNCKSATNAFSDINLKGFIKETVKVSAFRGMPYYTKGAFFYDVDKVNDMSIIRRNDYAPVNNDPVFYSTILSEKVSINDSYNSAFRFYHMFGSHPGAVMNENAEYEQNVTLQQAFRGNIKIIEAYLEQLKQVGAYDNSTIIITADHGEFKGYLAQPQTCLLLVKEANADTTVPLKTSYAPVCQEDLFATVIKELGGDYKSFGSTLEDISENSHRLRYHYNTETDPSTGYETYLREYVIDGVASDINNYTPTGKEWKVMSSISPH